MLEGIAQNTQEDLLEFLEQQNVSLEEGIDLRMEILQPSPIAHQVLSDSAIESMASISKEICEVYKKIADEKGGDFTKPKEISPSLKDQIRDLAKGSKGYIHNFSHEKAPEASRYLLPLLKVMKGDDSYDGILELANLLSLVPQEDLTISSNRKINETQNKISNFHYSDYYLEISALLHDRVCEYEESPESFFMTSNAPYVSQAVKNLAIAVNIFGRETGRGVNHYIHELPFATACKLVGDGEISQNRQVVLVLTALYNSVYNGLEYSPISKASEADRKHFLNVFTSSSQEIFLCNRVQNRVLNAIVSALEKIDLRDMNSQNHQQFNRELHHQQLNQELRELFLDENHGRDIDLFDSLTRPIVSRY